MAVCVSPQLWRSSALWRLPAVHVEVVTRSSFIARCMCVVRFVLTPLWCPTLSSWYVHTALSADIARCYETPVWPPTDDVWGCPPSPATTLKPGGSLVTADGGEADSLSMLALWAATQGHHKVLSGLVQPLPATVAARALW